MKTVGILLGVLLAVEGMAKSAEENLRVFVVPKFRLALMDRSVRPLPVFEKGEFAVVKMNQRTTEHLSRKIHEAGMGCGGFMDVTDEVARGGGYQAAWNYATQDAAPRTIDVPAKMNFKPIGDKTLTTINRPRLEKFIKDFVSFSDRYAKADTGTKASDWLADKALEVAKIYNRPDVTIEKVPTNSWYPQNSIVVRVPGVDSKLPAMVIGGHMDTYPNNKQGADDDGSGTATAMEIYTSLLETGSKFQRDIYLCFYAAEEWGLYGSQQVAKRFKDKGIAVRAAMQFDMTGFKSPKDTKSVYFISDNTTPAVTDFSKKLVTEYGVLTAQQIGDTACGYGCSDHASWFKSGVPTVYPFEASFSNYNKAIHTGNDTVQSLDFDHMMNFVKTGAVFMVEMAEPVTAVK